MKHKPTEAELEILQVLWSHGPSSVRFVHEQLSDKKEVFYTTTLKTMQVMHEKGLLSRDTSSRSHIYTSEVSKVSVQATLLSRFKETVFGGSTSQLILSALGSESIRKEELEALKSLINQIEDESE